MGDTSDNIPACRASAKRPPLRWSRTSAACRACMTTSRTRPSSPSQRSQAGSQRDKAELSHTLGTIRKDAPIDTTEGPISGQPGDPAAAAQLLAELEMHKLIPRWAGQRAPEAAAAGRGRWRAEPPPCRCCWRAVSTPLPAEGTQEGDGSWYPCRAGPSTRWIPTGWPPADDDAEIWMPSTQSRCIAWRWSTAAWARPAL